MILGPDARPISSGKLQPQSSMHAFDAAKRLNYRGMFFFPTLEPTDRMPTWTREEINRKATWLYDNVPQVRMVIDGLTLDEVDTGIWPKATTSNPVFNKAVNDAFHEQNKDPRFFHASATESFYSAQWLIRRSIRLYGELFGQKLLPGEDISLPTMHFVNSWQCGNASTAMDQSGRHEGVRRNARLRPIDYRFTLNADRSQWRDVPAENVMHFHDQFWQGQVRGMSGLASIARKLFTFDDIDRAEAAGLKLRTRQAYALVRQRDGDNGPHLLPGADTAEEIENSDGSKTLIQRIVQHDGDEIEVATPPAGFEMKVLESNRSATTVEYLRWILSAFATTTLYPPEYVFNLAGLGQGTLVRLVQKRVQRVKNTARQFQLIAQFVDPWYTYWLWERIKARAFDSISGGIPEDWWRHKNICPPDDTVDVRGEGQMYDARVDSGKMSPGTYHGFMGEDDEDVEDEVLSVRIRRLGKIKTLREQHPDLAEWITYETVFGSKKNSVLPGPEPSEGEDAKKKTSD